MTHPAQIPHTTSRIITRPGRFERPTVGLEGRRSLHESALFRGRFGVFAGVCGECAESGEPPAGLEPARSITSAVDSRAVSAGERARRPVRPRAK